jgi:exoribonuclease-2
MASLGLAKKSLEQLVKEKAIMAVQAKENHRPFIIRQVDSLKSLGRASLDIHPSKHNRFGLHKYCAVTSPLRRYTDLIVHYQIKSALRKESVPPFTANALYKVVPPVDNRAQAIKGLQKDSVRYWLYNYMESIYKRDPERLFPALILEASSEKANDQCRVYLHEFGIETEAIMTRKMNRGETIDVQIQYISPFYDHLVLREVRGQRYRVDGPM